MGMRPLSDARERNQETKGHGAEVPEGSETRQPCGCGADSIDDSDSASCAHAVDGSVTVFPR